MTRKFFGVLAIVAGLGILTILFSALGILEYVLLGCASFFFILISAGVVLYGLWLLTVPATTIKSERDAK